MGEAHWTPGRLAPKHGLYLWVCPMKRVTPIQGHLDFASISLTPTTGTLLMRGIFSNPEREDPAGTLCPGACACQRRPAFLVPQEAVGYDQRGSYVLVVNEKNVVQRLSVKTGALVDHLRVIEEGLTGKEWVVIKGIQKAIPGRPVTPERQDLRTSGTSSPQSTGQRRQGP